MSRINTNVSSLVAQKTLARSNAQLQTSLTRLSTGLRINTGKDDPAGLIASENLGRDITAAQKAISNTEQANQLISTADSALGQISGLLNDIRGLVTEAANTGVLSDEQIAANQLQVDSSLEAIDRIAQVTTFQGRKLLDGSLDFITNVTAGSSTIADLQINKATLKGSASLPVSVTISAAATQAQIDYTAAGFTAGASASGSITFSDITTPAEQATGTVTLTNSSGSIDIDAVAGEAADGVVGNTTDVIFQRASDAALASGTYSLTTTGGGFDITAVAGEAADGAAGNNLSIVIADSAAATGATYDAGTNTIAVNVNDGGTATVQDIADAIDALAEFSTSAVTSGATVYDNTDNGTTNSVTSGGDDGTTAATYDATGNAITVNVGVGATVTEVAAEIDGLDEFAATAATGGSNDFDAADLATVTAPLADGADAVADDDVITIAAANGGTEYDGTLTFVKSSSATAGSITVAVTDGDITVTVDDSSTYDLTDIVDEINTALGPDYTATLSTSDGDGSFDASADDAVTANLTGGTADTDSGLAASLVVRLGSSSGSDVFTFSAGATVGQIVSSVNLLSDSTGVTAVNNAGTLELRSTAYGTGASVDVDVINEGTGGTFAAGLSGTYDTGSDISGTINGYVASGKGNTLSINTTVLGLSLTVDDGSSTAVEFSITGGGAVFQLGPDVVSNQQARLGIGSVNTAKLGGVNGRLYELRSGNSSDLTNDPTNAARIVDQAINKVTSLRGRLGAFQKTTLETNINSLNDTITNLTEAQSSIRDADFAAETAKLTRAQILVQSGTSVLQIANSNPQQVLALLRG